MRILAAFLILLPAATAQFRGPGLPPPIVVPSAGALGGGFAGQGSSRPLGGIAPPSFPAGVQPKPAPPPPNASGYRYYGPVYYVPSASELEALDPSQTANAPYHPANPPIPQTAVGRATSAVQFSGSAPATQPQTVIVNQYFGKDGPDNTTRVASTTSSGETAATTREYYMIAYKNRHVVTALAYWLDGDTLHYVTSENAHNQSSLALIDLEMTTRLNADREVPFVVPGK